MRITIETPLTTQYVMDNAHAAYWYNARSADELVPEHAQYLRKGKRTVWPRLTQARLVQGVASMAQWATARATSGAAERLGRVLSSQGDGEDLDVLLQLSLFGSIIYG